MQQVERWAEEKGCRRVYLRSNVARQEAHFFYHRLGYRCLKTQLALGKTLSNNEDLNHANTAG